MCNTSWNQYKTQSKVVRRSRLKVAGGCGSPRAACNRSQTGGRDKPPQVQERVHADVLIDAAAAPTSASRASAAEAAAARGPAAAAGAAPPRRLRSWPRAVVAAPHSFKAWPGSFLSRSASQRRSQITSQPPRAPQPPWPSSPLRSDAWCCWFFLTGRATCKRPWALQGEALATRSSLPRRLQRSPAAPRPPLQLRPVTASSQCPRHAQQRPPETTSADRVLTLLAPAASAAPRAPPAAPAAGTYLGNIEAR